SSPPARRRPATAEPSSPSPTIPSVAMPAALPNARSLAVLARRVVAGVGGVLQELVGPVGPELAHAREGVDDRVLKPAADALDLADVDVLDRVAEVVEPHGAARGVGEGAAADERELLPQPRLLELLREPQRVGAGEDGVDRVDIAAEPRDVGGEIGGAERRPKLLEHLAARLLEGPLEARRHLPAEG